MPRYCVLCQMVTLFVFVKDIVARGKFTGYRLHKCSRCFRMGIAMPYGGTGSN